MAKKDREALEIQFLGKTCKTPAIKYPISAFIHIPTFQNETLYVKWSKKLARPKLFLAAFILSTKHISALNFINISQKKLRLVD